MTGGGGFIGSHIVEEILARGDSARVFDNFATGDPKNLEGFSGDLEVVEGDLRNPKDLDGAMKGVDYVIHEAALPSVPRSIADPVTSHEVNATGTLNLLVAARDAGVKRLVAAGSSSAYGDEPDLPKIETMMPRPLAPYASSKLAAEHYCRAFYKCYGFETAVTRYFNVFGPRQNPDSQYAAVIPKFIRSMLNGESPTIFGDGQHSRDFTYVSNVVLGTLAAATAAGAAGETFNVACGGRYTLNELVAEINRDIGAEVVPNYTDRRAGDVPHSMASIEKAKSILDYHPVVTFEEGLRRTIEWLRK